MTAILSSGYSMDGQAEEIMKRGCNGFIQKPIRMADLSQKLREILEDRYREGELRIKG
jgi:CheY-like chemotaxis protein